MKKLLYAALAVSILSASSPPQALCQQLPRHLPFDLLNARDTVENAKNIPLRAAPIFETPYCFAPKEVPLESRIEDVSVRTGIDVPPFMMSIVRMYTSFIADYHELQRIEHSYLALTLMQEKGASLTLYIYQKPDFFPLPDSPTLPLYLNLQIKMP